jgi:hypothetical protein
MTGINMLAIHVAWPFAGVVWMLFAIETLADDFRLYTEGRDAAR